MTTENQFSVDGQPITDQQSKVFSNQLPDTAVQSMEVIEARPGRVRRQNQPRHQVTTRSGQGVTKPSGQINFSYGSFGSATGGFDLGYGKDKWGNFIAVDGLNTGRFLDSPEFAIYHDKGNEQNVFDRVDYQFNAANSFHLNLNYSAAPGFRPPTPSTTSTSEASTSPVLLSADQTDQRSKIGTFNISPSYTRVLNQSSVLEPRRLLPQATTTTTTPAAIRSPTSAPFSSRASARIAVSLTPAHTPTSATSGVRTT